MKTILLLILFTVPLFSQVIYYDDTSLGSVPVSTTNPLPVEFEANQTIMQQCDTAFIWGGDTLNSASPDTLDDYGYYALTNLNTMFKVRYQLTITADSTIQISTSGSFTSGLTFTVNTGESWTTSYLSPVKFPIIYVKRGSAITGVVTYRFDIHGY